MKDTITIKLSIGGNLRFLSHQETVSLFQRALVRTGVRLVYSEGFSPRPRLSLPLPRSVGIATEEDVLCFAVESGGPDMFDCSAFKAKLTGELPAGIELASVEVVSGSTTFHPVSAEYVFKVKKAVQIENVKNKVAALAGPENLLVERHQPKKGTTRMVNARDFVESAEMVGDEIVVRCRITTAGAIRVDELMKILEIEQSMLAGAIVRRNVHWQRSN